MGETKVGRGRGRKINIRSQDPLLAIVRTAIIKSDIVDREAVSNKQRLGGLEYMIGGAHRPPHGMLSTPPPGWRRRTDDVPRPPPDTPMIARRPGTVKSGLLLVTLWET